MSTSESSHPMLQVSDVDFAYGQHQVLFGVSLEVRHREALALLGTNGAGKSTLLKVIAGLETSQSGAVAFDGEDVTGVPAERLTGDGMLLVVGGRSVFTDMTVDDNLEVQALAAGWTVTGTRSVSTSCSQRFPGSPNVASRKRARCPVASSSSWR